MSDSFQNLLASSEKPCGIKEQLDEGEERNFQNVGYKQRRFGAEWKINRESVWRGGGNGRKILSFKNNTGFLYSSQTSEAYLTGNSLWLIPCFGSPAEISKMSNWNSAISANVLIKVLPKTEQQTLWIMLTQWSQRWPRRICKPRSSALSPAEYNSTRAWHRKGLGFYLLHSSGRWKENLTSLIA